MTFPKKGFSRDFDDDNITLAESYKDVCPVDTVPHKRAKLFLL